MAALVTVAEYAARMGVDPAVAYPDPSEARTQLEGFLDDASSAVRAAANDQQIAQVEGDVQEIRGTWDDVLQLPQRPVTAVTAVTLLHGDGTSTDLTDDDWELLPGGRLKRTMGAYFDGERGLPWAGPDGAVRVTYTHGWDPVPGWIVAIVVGYAARAIANPQGFASVRVGESYDVRFRGDGPPPGQLDKYERKQIRDYFRRQP